MKQFLPLAVLLVIASGLVYAASVKTIRLTTDDGLLEQAQNIATSLKSQSAKGAQPNAIIDIATSDQPFIIVLDKDNNSVYSSAQLDENTPVLPDGSAKKAVDSGEHSFTWIPKKGVRLATVVVPYSSTDENGVVVVGKSLRLNDKKYSAIARTLALGTLAGLATLLGVISLIRWALLADRKSNVEVKSTQKTASVAHTVHSVVSKSTPSKKVVVKKKK